MTRPRQTELQIIVQALTALQYEMRAMTLAVRAPDFVLAEMHELQTQAKTLMQSAQADADLLAFVEQTQEKGTQIVLALDEPVEPIEPKSMRGSGD